MKFDVVVGNPPYQEDISKKEIISGQKRVRNIFQYFQLLADNLANSFTSLIYPGGRWIHQSGKGLKLFGNQQINDPRLALIIFYPHADDVFQGVAIADGISIVLKNQHKTSGTFKYIYSVHGDEEIIDIDSPGTSLIPLNPKDMIIVNNIDKFVEKNSLNYISESVFSQKLFGIESGFVEENPSKVKLYDPNDFDKSKYIKLFTNDKAGKMGRSKWFIAEKDVITRNQSLIYEWQVVVSSANAGGQKRDNQISIIDNNSAFGRSRVALKSFKTEKEAYNFLKYAQSKFIRFAFLMTDEALSSLGMKVPDILDYTNENKFVDFNEDVDVQLFELFGLSDVQIKYVISRVDGMR